MASINTIPYRATPDPEGDSQSSSSNSPARQDYGEESDSAFYTGNNDSQSSIGVGTFQDMQVSSEICEPPANRLPAEVLIGIFSKLSSPQDLLNCMLVSKRWARNSVDLLWHRPACTIWNKHSSICKTLSLSHPYFAYRDFIKRLNLAQLADIVNDGTVQPLFVCSRVERLTLTNCEGLTDSGLIGLLTDSNNLLALDISGDTQITAASMMVLAENCTRLQGLNISGCTKISNEAMMAVADNCKFIKRLKLNDCEQLEDSAILRFAQNCQNILEIDLHQCKMIGNTPVTELLTNGRSLRELRLANCDLIADSAFLNLPPNQTYEHLRILDLTSCARLTDRAIEKIIDVAPRLRNLVFAKCRNLTDVAVHAISKLGKNLHYLHLGHCGHITDASVVKLVQSCNRIRYIDLGCCVNLTDASVMKLASLPKLRRIGLVKCSNITDESVYALAQYRAPRDVRHHRLGEDGYLPGSSLERVHLSYCTNLTLNSIVVLLNNCQKLTHLSLTGVQAFLRPDLEQFCREAPPEFTEHQRSVFCVFSGAGVTGLRRHLNHLPGHGGMEDFDQDTVGDADADDDQTMTGLMGATALNADEDADADGDEELEDADGGPPPFAT
ncbi:SCF E3 ubiquitin ligase complex F-box protein-like protein grrA [Tricladium varicosporioides]|nr:SCF E3 ubiquitin ligase complex F-box protein-like protein grrA [Hymenoscyphus varicosporioides]